MCVCALRWLAEVFKDARQVRFVNIVRHPALNSHCENPRKCGGYNKKCKKDELTELRIAYVEKWIRVHDVMVDHLRMWGKSALAKVKVVRYEQVTKECSCQKLFRFVFSD